VSGFRKKLVRDQGGNLPHNHSGRYGKGVLYTHWRLCRVSKVGEENSAFGKRNPLYSSDDQGELSFEDVWGPGERPVKEERGMCGS